MAQRVIIGNWKIEKRKELARDLARHWGTEPAASIARRWKIPVTSLNGFVSTLRKKGVKLPRSLQVVKYLDNDFVQELCELASGSPKKTD